MLPAPRPILALDAASPRSSVAVALEGELLAAVDETGGAGARPLVALVAEVTRAAGLTPRDLGGLVAVRGPGSFTGVRLALATAWALHESLALPATAVTSFEALAWQLSGTGVPLLGLVDALRGEWYAQRLAPGDPPRPLASPRILSVEALEDEAPCLAIGFGASRLAARLPHFELREPQPLAPALAIALSRRAPESQPDLLLAPLYLRAPTPEVRRAERSAGE